ncbi:hypothetical protein CALCODRAFT_486374 [Calocera cornea HHB12733]|uniref:Uncharacterized protein n=1 Tax=Calocera cornea HHB12733 TaxID=1353952 RepID=A0A165DRX1_9BASI|nr:hypothetical protein CALCODRAFT_486374 [Calocera cornea HHB12733]
MSDQPMIDPTLLTDQHTLHRLAQGAIESVEIPNSSVLTGDVSPRKYYADRHAEHVGLLNNDMDEQQSAQTDCQGISVSEPHLEDDKYPDSSAILGMDNTVASFNDTPGQEDKRPTLWKNRPLHKIKRDVLTKLLRHDFPIFVAESPIAGVVTYKKLASALLKTNCVLTGLDPCIPPPGYHKHLYELLFLKQYVFARDMWNGDTYIRRMTDVERQEKDRIVVVYTNGVQYRESDISKHFGPSSVATDKKIRHSTRAYKSTTPPDWRALLAARSQRTPAWKADSNPDSNVSDEPSSSTGRASLKRKRSRTSDTETDIARTMRPQKQAKDQSAPSQHTRSIEYSLSKHGVNRARLKRSQAHVEYRHRRPNAIYHIRKH